MKNFNIVIMVQSAANWRNTHTHVNRTHSLTHTYTNTVKTHFALYHIRLVLVGCEPFACYLLGSFIQNMLVQRIMSESAFTFKFGN